MTATASSQVIFYHCQKNGVDIPGANDASYTTPALSLADNGAKFICFISIPGAAAATSEATPTVTN